MHVFQKYLLFLLFFSLLFACRKKRCSDGVMNHGETGIDCGGKCAPCPELTNREIAVQDYNDNYLGSAISDNNLSWTGNVSSCNPGGVSASTDQKVLQRINYFRRLVGLNDNITLDEKIIAAHRYGKKRVIIPEKNCNDLEDIPSEVLSEIKLYPVKTMLEVLQITQLLPCKNDFKPLKYQLGKVVSSDQYLSLH